MLAISISDSTIAPRWLEISIKTNKDLEKQSFNRYSTWTLNVIICAKKCFVGVYSHVRSLSASLVTVVPASHCFALTVAEKKTPCILSWRSIVWNRRMIASGFAQKTRWRKRLWSRCRSVFWNALTTTPRHFGDTVSRMIPFHGGEARLTFHSNLWFGLQMFTDAGSKWWRHQLSVAVLASEFDWSTFEPVWEIFVSGTCRRIPKSEVIKTHPTCCGFLSYQLIRDNMSRFSNFFVQRLLNQSLKMRFNAAVQTQKAELLIAALILPKSPRPLQGSHEVKELSVAFT